MSRILFLVAAVCFCFSTPSVLAKEVTVPPKEQVVILEKLAALQAILDIKANLNDSLQDYREQLKAAISEAEKNNLKAEIAVIEKELLETDLNFEEISTDTDISRIRDTPTDAFSLEEQLVSLVKPTIQEMRHLTQGVRNKAELREKISRNEEKQKYVGEAIAHLSELVQHADTDKALKEVLVKDTDFWQKQAALIDSQQTSALQQLKKLEEAEVPFTESAQNYLRDFFQKRGLYISQALLAMLAIFLVSYLIRALIKKLIPAFNQNSRSFRLRLLDLLHRLITLIALIICPVLVFYLTEDWVLFSFSLLILLGIVWSLKSVIPEYRAQIQLFLNVGAVREGERLVLDGIPWRVEAINIFSILENPVAGMRQRVPIKDLVDLKSRPGSNDEPWFPCTKGDWVLLSDGVRGKVIGMSSELIKLVQRGGAHITYTTSNFLALSPQNLSVNFRIKETIGISYDLQASSTREIPETLQKTIENRMREEGYEKVLLNLRVEFEYANTSSLDLVVIADFKGSTADLYNRLRRAIQRWCVDACTENQWEMPFTQIAVHNGKAEQN